MAHPSALIVPAPTFVFDENSKGMLTVLRAARPACTIADLPSLGIPNGTLDVALLAQLGRQGRFALIARDGQMLTPLAQRQAWATSGVTLFLLRRWGQLSLFELSRRLLFLWPSIVEHAEAGPQGAAWRVDAAIPGPGHAFRRITGQHAS